MAAGLSHAAASEKAHPAIYSRIDALSGSWSPEFSPPPRNAGVAMTANRVGSMFTWFFAPGRCTIGIRPQKSDNRSFGNFFAEWLDHGVYLPPAQYEAAFLSAAHSEADWRQRLQQPSLPWLESCSPLGHGDGMQRSSSHLRSLKPN